MFFLSVEDREWRLAVAADVERKIFGYPDRCFFIGIFFDEMEFDSYRIDDAALVVKDKAIWLYYKGRSRSHGRGGPGKTRMGVAFADQPEGPYIKHTNPLVDKSHEVLVWNQGGGIASLASINKSINVAPDGLNFSMLRDNLARIPAAPGLYRPHLTDHSVKGLPGWGISHTGRDGDMYLIRFNIQSNPK